MDNCNYPIPPLAEYRPDATSIQTSSGRVLLVDKWGDLKVVTNAHSGSSQVIVGVTANGDTVPVQVTSDGCVCVTFEDAPGLQRGASTDSGGMGYLEYDHTTPLLLDSIPLVEGQTLNIHGLHAFGTAQAEITLDLVEGATRTHLLVGGVTEDSPSWDPNMGGVPIVVTATQDSTIQLRIQGTRECDLGDGTGRIFARLV